MSTLSAYRVPPLHEWKAARELRDHGIRAYVPRDPASDRKAPAARGYVFSSHKPAFAKHVRGKVGNVAPAELARLYVKRQLRAVEQPNPYSPGQTVYRGEVPATVISISGRMCVVRTTMLGKEISQALHYSQLRPG
jgi:hypothetical protein